MIESVADLQRFLNDQPRFRQQNDDHVMRDLVAQCHHPERSYKIIHVTGTNGKGTAAITAAHLLKGQGFKVGLFVSPYITRFNERIQLNDVPISDQHLLAVAQDLMRQFSDYSEPITQFEWLTLIMLVAFARYNVEIAVIEVGIGGRHDRTNLVYGDVGLITSIGADHLALIGPTLRDVAFEKAGIIKPHQVTFLGPMKAELQRIIEDEAKQQQASLMCWQRDWRETHQFNSQGATLAVWWENRCIFQGQVSCFADWQVQDCALGILAAVALLAQFQQLPQLKRFQQALSCISFPGRFELLQTQPCVVVDGAHNPPAIHALIEGVAKRFSKAHVYLITAMMRDKDIEQNMALLTQAGWDLAFTRLSNERSLTKSELKQRVTFPVCWYDTWQQAYQEVLKKANSQDVILFAGSLYLVSEVRNFFKSR